MSYSVTGAFPALKSETIYVSETSVSIYQTTKRHIPDDGILVVAAKT
jgi:hypothetical protein